MLVVAVVIVGGVLDCQGGDIRQHGTGRSGAPGGQAAAEASRSEAGPLMDDTEGRGVRLSL